MKQREAFVSQSVRRAVGMLTATVVTAAVATGCGGSSSNTPGAQGGTQTITVGIPPAVSADVVQLAQDKGYFAAHHLNVTLKLLNGGAATVPALEGGAIQIAQANVLSEIQGAGQGLSVPCFAGAFSIANGTPQRGFLPLIAGSKSGISNASQLTGKTIAVNATGGVNQLMADAWLHQHGVDYHSIHYIGMDFPTMTAAIGGGRVPAGVSVEPFSTELMHEGSARMLTGDPLSAIPGQPIFACWNATASWIGGHASTVKDFVAAIDESNAYVKNNPAGFRAWLQTHTKISAPVAATLALPAFTTSMSSADVTNWQAAGKQYGILNDAQSKVAAIKVYKPVTG